MKVRKIVVTMEIKTDASLKSLKDVDKWYHLDEGTSLEIKQIQINVIKKVKE